MKVIVNNYCTLRHLEVITNEVTKTIQKNKIVSGSKFETILTIVDIFRLFTKPSVANCSISEWFITEPGSMTPMTSDNEVATRMK